MKVPFFSKKWEPVPSKSYKSWKKLWASILELFYDARFSQPEQNLLLELFSSSLFYVLQIRGILLAFRDGWYFEKSTQSLESRIFLSDATSSTWNNFLQRCKTELNNALQCGQQQDCCDFYNYFSSVLSRTKRLLHQNHFAGLYSFLLQQEIRCLSCSNASTTITNTFNLEVTLMESDHVTTLSTLVENYFELELVERQCPHCR